MHAISISSELMVNVCTKWAKCEHVIQQSLSWKFFRMHKNMEIELWGGEFDVDEMNITWW
jgi:hypothetical protein